MSFILIFLFLLSIKCTQRQIQFSEEIENSNLEAFKLISIYQLGKPSEANSKLGASNFRTYNLEDEKSRILIKELSDKEFKIDSNFISNNNYTTNLLKNSDIEDLLRSKVTRKTILNMAKMAAHAYEKLPDLPWADLEPGWHVNKTFGWYEDRIRGHVFSNSDNSILIIAFKGTSFPFLGLGSDGGDVGSNDRDMDNLMFSCCCGKTSSLYTPVCGCGSNGNICKDKCLHKAASQNTTYYHGALLIYNHIKQRYPNSRIVFTGHSLGGALASLVGLKTSLPAYTFEAPGDLIYAYRIGLIDKYNKNKPRPLVFHFGNLADPLYVGHCKGSFSLCYLAGYAMDSGCHTGTTCTFDMGWSESLRYHRIANVISSVLVNWVRSYYNAPIKCTNQELGYGTDKANCRDCSKWTYE